jgi:hypothetical protein
LASTVLGDEPPSSENDGALVDALSDGPPPSPPRRPVRLLLLLRRRRQTKIAAARTSRKSAAAPTAMPAIAPVERGEEELVAEAKVPGSVAGVERSVAVELGMEVVGAEVAREPERLLSMVVVVALVGGVQPSGRSDAFHASWIMGAYKFSVVSLELGKVMKPKLLLEPSWQVTVGRVVDLATIRHVWPLRLSHLNPVGQQPTKVSWDSIRNCTFHCDVTPSTAEHADVWPAGHSRPGE